MALWSSTDKISPTSLNTAPPQTPRPRRRRQLVARGNMIDRASNLLHPRQHLELMERRRRRQRPFQRRGSSAPRIIGGLLLADEGIDDTVDEDQDAEAGDVGADRGD